MSTYSQYTNQAIAAATSGDWTEAIAHNERILQESPDDIGTLNRLGFCYIQLGKVKHAKACYEKVLALEKFNPIANKYIQLLKGKIAPHVQSIQTTQDFIEEPGKTKSLPLLKLADPNVLQAIPVALPCTMVVKKHRVDIITTKEKQYLGCLPDDVAYRLQKMTAVGNTYAVVIQSTSKKSCVVFIKETHRDPKSPFATAFPLTSMRTTHQGEIILDEAPLDTRETGDEIEAPEIEDIDSTTE